MASWWHAGVGSLFVSAARAVGAARRPAIEKNPIGWAWLPSAYFRPREKHPPSIRRFSTSPANRKCGRCSGGLGNLGSARDCAQAEPGRRQ